MGVTLPGREGVAGDVPVQMTGTSLLASGPGDQTSGRTKATVVVPPAGTRATLSIGW